ncbi:hypothetical protein EA473_20085 [Natrarchaeobius chitinivorans]|uniref:Uncharacterized protein n=1 Tax=Natrarchaeobius chitinivorans TaxID=1679083 RepID=A0A3N6LN41_NATCH|nr:hypothetical protein EA473_20085 [Natrarchaeobius chitinivorans]
MALPWLSAVLSTRSMFDFSGRNEMLFNHDSILRTFSLDFNTVLRRFLDGIDRFISHVRVAAKRIESPKNEVEIVSGIME